MYYEEKVILGVLHFRSSPEGKWMKFGDIQLTERIKKQELIIRMLEEKIKAMPSAAAIHGSSLEQECLNAAGVQED